jgi:hypothetical protein
MASPWDKLLQKIGRDRGRLWTRSRRRAALREIEGQFHLRLTEEEVFQAATLFLSLLAEQSLINKEAVAQEVRRQLPPEKKAKEEKKSAA